MEIEDFKEGKIVVAFEDVPMSYTNDNVWVPKGIYRIKSENPISGITLGVVAPILPTEELHAGRGIDKTDWGYFREPTEKERIMAELQS